MENLTEQYQAMTLEELETLKRNAVLTDDALYVLDSVINQKRAVDQQDESADKKAQGEIADGHQDSGTGEMPSINPESPLYIGKNIDRLYRNSKYSFGRNIAKIVGFVGWLTLLIGSFYLIFTLVNFTLIGLLTGLSTAISGLFCIAVSQGAIASMDSADHGLHIIKVLEAKRY